MKLDKNIDYGKALKDLFDGLKFAEEKARSKDEYAYPNAYGRATMAIKSHIVNCTDLSYNDVDKEISEHLSLTPKLQS